MWQVFMTESKRTETKAELDKIKGLWKLQRNSTAASEIETFLWDKQGTNSSAW